MSLWKLSRVRKVGRMRVKINRCSGHCCTEFCLPYSPDQLWAFYDYWLRARGCDSEVPLEMNESKSLVLMRDIFLVAPMVEYLGFGISTQKKLNPSDESLLGTAEIKAHRYRCRHFCSGLKKCMIYEHRPQMCRNYPGLGRCEYDGCTWDAGRGVKLTAKENRARTKLLIKKSEKS